MQTLTASPHYQHPRDTKYIIFALHKQPYKNRAITYHQSPLARKNSNFLRAAPKASRPKKRH